MNNKDSLPPSTKRVELQTSKKTNKTIQENTINNLNKFKDASYNELSARIETLENEWDTERVLEANAASITFISTILGFTLSSYWFIFIGIISFFLLQHAVQGWCPPLPLIRSLGVRTPEEIYNEKTVLKILRGDFDNKNKNYLKLYEATKK